MLKYTAECDSVFYLTMMCAPVISGDAVQSDFLKKLFTKLEKQGMILGYIKRD